VKKIVCIALITSAAWAQQQSTCPSGTAPLERKDGNTRTFSCLDNQGRPHGTFSVRAYADTTTSDSGNLIVLGNFSHGKQDGVWTTFTADGQESIVTRFENGKQVEAQDAP
jgi:antitoxin component YwqK of YwqJK toxin-antitoxin module